jgi:hypothetical protein
MNALNRDPPMSHHHCQYAFSDRRPDNDGHHVAVRWTLIKCQGYHSFVLNMFSIDMKLYIFICLFKRILPNAHFAKPVTVIIELNIEATKLILILINFSHKICTMTAIEMGTSVCDAQLAIKLVIVYCIRIKFCQCLVAVAYICITHYQ